MSELQKERIARLKDKKDELERKIREINKELADLEGAEKAGLIKVGPNKYIKITGIRLDLIPKQQ